MATVTRVGQAGLQGWRDGVAAKVAPPVAERTPLNIDQARALIGGAFIGLGILYLTKTAQAIAREVKET